MSLSRPFVGGWGRRTAGSLRALRSRNFAILWFGNLLSNTGSFMQQVAEPWLVLRLSNSPLLLGLDSFMTDPPILVHTDPSLWVATRPSQGARRRARPQIKASPSPPREPPKAHRSTRE